MAFTVTTVLKKYRSLAMFSPIYENTDYTNYAIWQGIPKYLVHPAMETIVLITASGNIDMSSAGIFILASTVAASDKSITIDRTSLTEKERCAIIINNHATAHIIINTNQLTIEPGEAYFVYATNLANSGISFTRYLPFGHSSTDLSYKINQGDVEKLALLVDATISSNIEMVFPGYEPFTINLTVPETNLVNWSAALVSLKFPIFLRLSSTNTIIGVVQIGGSTGIIPITEFTIQSNALNKSTFTYKKEDEAVVTSVTIDLPNHPR